MKTIHILPDEVISHIAAGEVIERPVWAVKELVENALDAKARHITIDISNGGLERIVVSDDGVGMHAEDLLECWKLHATSKLVTVEDLSTVATLGFRGEALASIAAVSSLTIQSRVESQLLGNRVSISYGHYQDHSRAGMPTGTRVVVDHIFSNVPARKKFIASARAEFRHIVDLVTRLAFSHPSVRFVLKHNTKTVLDLQPQAFENRVAEMIGVDSQRLLTVSFQDSYIDVAGIVAHPQLAGRSIRKQYVIVNGRPIKDQTISTAIRDAFGTLLAHDSFPIAVLAISLPHEFVDVNVHPRKEHITFVSPTFVYESVKEAVRQTLARHNIVFHALPWSSQTPLTQSAVAKRLKAAVVPERVPAKKVVGYIQLENTYCVFTTTQGVLLVDQHAAHERILFEQFKTQLKKEQKNSMRIPLNNPVRLTLSAEEADTLEENIDTFHSLGIDVEKKENVWRIKAVSAVFADRDVEEVVGEYLDDLLHSPYVRSHDTKTYRMLTFLSCRSAIKAGEKINQSQAKKLLQELLRTPSHTTCPHGRPTMIELPLADLHKLFKRSL